MGSGEWSCLFTRQYCGKQTKNYLGKTVGHREVLVHSMQGASLLMLFLRALLLPTVQGRKLFPSYRRKEQKNKYTED